MQLNGDANRTLSNNSAVYASCPNVNYLSNANPEGPPAPYSLMAGYGSTIGSNGNTENNWSSSNNFGNHIGLLGPSQRKPNAHRRERQLSSSFSGKFSSFYSTISMANEAMEDDNCQGTSIYSPSNSQVSSPVAFRTFSAPTSPTPCYFNNQPPQFGVPTNVSENSFIDYDRQANQQVNFYPPNYPPEPPASSQANPVNDYSFPFYTPSNVETPKYATESAAPNGSSYYFGCAPPEFNS